MIKVLINGTPIYKLCFNRRKYKTVNKKKLTLGEVLRKIDGLGTVPDEQVQSILKEAFGGKPLYETTALVYMVDAKAGEPPVATASTRQSKLDENSRNTAREVALGRLLRTKDNPPFTEIERKAIRSAYDNRLAKPKKSPPTGGGNSNPPAEVAKVVEAIGHRVTNRVATFPHRPQVQLSA